jgi:hypothetical protein
MKIFRFVVAAVVMLGLSGLAGATTVRVLDPNSPQASSPNIYSLDTPIDFSFYTCPSFISNGSDPMGCFSAVNYTGSVITDFTATITAKTSIPGGLSCPTGGDYGLAAGFSDATCSASGDTMTFDFSGGDIGLGSTIWIVEDGMKDSDFKKDAGTFSVAATPEPSSIWFALTGMSSLGYVVRRRRRATIV